MSIWEYVFMEEWEKYQYCIFLLLISDKQAWATMVNIALVEKRADS